MTIYFEPNPSFIFREMGSWSNRVDPAYGEKEPSPVGPTGILGGGAGMESGFDPDPGFWDSIHELRSSVSCNSERRVWLRKMRALDFDFLMDLVWILSKERRSVFFSSATSARVYEGF